MATAVVQRKGYDNVELSLSEDDDPVKEKKKSKGNEKKSSTESKSKESKETSKEEDLAQKKFVSLHFNQLAWKKEEYQNNTFKHKLTFS